MPRLWLIAGPNGVGKTTFAFANVRRISGSVHFVNLDEIARGLSPLDPGAARVRAARVALDMQQDFIEQKESFSIETTLSGLTYLNLVRRAKAAGFKIILVYFSVPDVSICIARVAKRVELGGHHVPEADIRRRFDRSSVNLAAYINEADIWAVWNNTETHPEPAASGGCGCRDNALMASRHSPLASLPIRAALDALPLCEADADRASFVATLVQP